jgi:hypothetical protein
MFDKEDIWQKLHETDNIEWLAGSSPYSVYKFHKITPPKNKTILEIGIGLGHSIEVMDKDNKVIAVDICQKALDRVSHIADTFLTEDMGDIQEGSVDTALCHLVFQHCTDEMVEFIIEKTLRCLTPEGSFHFQFAECTEVDLLTNYKFAFDHDIMHFRDKDTIEEMVKRSGGVVRRVLDPINWRNRNTTYRTVTWHMFEVGKEH